MGWLPKMILQNILSITTLEKSTQKKCPTNRLFIKIKNKSSSYRRGFILSDLNYFI
jgi:hypothetical protein